MRKFKISLIFVFVLSMANVWATATERSTWKNCCNCSSVFHRGNPDTVTKDIIASALSQNFNASWEFVVFVENFSHRYCADFFSVDNLIALSIAIEGRVRSAGQDFLLYALAAQRHNPTHEEIIQLAWFLGYSRAEAAENILYHIRWRRKLIR